MNILGFGMDVRNLAIANISLVKRKRVEYGAHSLQRFVEFGTLFFRRFLLVRCMIFA